VVVIESECAEVEKLAVKVSDEISKKKWLSAYSSESCHPVHGNAAT